MTNPLKSIFKMQIMKKRRGGEKEKMELKEGANFDNPLTIDDETYRMKI